MAFWNRMEEGWISVRLTVSFLPSSLCFCLASKEREKEKEWSRQNCVCHRMDWQRLLCGFLFCLLLQQPKPLNHVKGHICQIYGDDVGLTAEGELFVACNECAFPVCRPYYDYERNDGNQSCPQCKNRYKRHKGRVWIPLLLLLLLPLLWCEGWWWHLLLYDGWWRWR